MGLGWVAFDWIGWGWIGLGLVWFGWVGLGRVNCQQGGLAVSAVGAHLCYL
jgi:hypothetical protein